MKYNRLRIICIAVILGLGSFGAPAAHASSGAFADLSIAGFFDSVWLWFSSPKGSDGSSDTATELDGGGAPCPDCQDGPGWPPPPPPPPPPREFAAYY